MVAHVQVDLGDPVEAESTRQVDQQPHVHAVPAHERNRFEHRPAPPVFARQRLDDAAELGEEHRQQRPGDQFGHAPAARSLGLGAVVVPLHEVAVGIREQRAEHASYEAHIEVADVGIAPHDDVAARHVQRLPQHLALAVAAAEIGQHVCGVHHMRAGAARLLRGGVGRVIVDHDDLIDHPGCEEVLADRRDDRSHGGRLVARRQAHRHRLASLRVEQCCGRELVVATSRRACSTAR